MLNEWTDKGYTATLDDSNKLLRAAHDLNEALGAGGGATSPDDVLRAVRQMGYILDRMQTTLNMTKVSAMLRPGD